MKFKLVGIGEVLWDLLPTGRQMGGAPANFAYHAGALGEEAQLISRVGNDADGRELLEQLCRLGVPTDCIEVDGTLPTGTVSVELAPDGQPVLHPRRSGVGCHRGRAGRPIGGAAANAVCFGTLAQRSEVSASRSGRWSARLRLRRCGFSM
jgi:fructokinase